MATRKLSATEDRNIARLLEAVDSGKSLQYRWDTGREQIVFVDLFDDRKEVGQANCQTITSTHEMCGIISDGLNDKMSFRFEC